MFKKILSYVLPEDPTSVEAIIRRNIKREVAKLGGNVFGPIQAGRRREFFSLDEHTWNSEGCRNLLCRSGQHWGNDPNRLAYLLQSVIGECYLSCGINSIVYVVISISFAIYCDSARTETRSDFL